ncbi:unnamed protein product [Phyllotreta striolata]|uniref:FGGY carbohydrate kinase domain-containing protein n=1 Tax=Phyllotreta striolata TaxID=444603 RepID=A0A9N9XL36_PHYSR|nr:unnamed protein product [Phyllotreta striolata]
MSSTSRTSKQQTKKSVAPPKNPEQQHKLPKDSSLKDKQLWIKHWLYKSNPVIDQKSFYVNNHMPVTNRRTVTPGPSAIPATRPKTLSPRGKKTPPNYKPSTDYRTLFEQQKKTSSANFPRQPKVSLSSIQRRSSKPTPKNSTKKLDYVTSGSKLSKEGSSMSSSLQPIASRFVQNKSSTFKSLASVNQSKHSELKAVVDYGGESNLAKAPSKPDIIDETPQENPPKVAQTRNSLADEEGSKPEYDVSSFHLASNPNNLQPSHVSNQSFNNSKNEDRDMTRAASKHTQWSLNASLQDSASRQRMRNQTSQEKTINRELMNIINLDQDIRKVNEPPSNEETSTLNQDSSRRRENLESTGDTISAPVNENIFKRLSEINGDQEAGFFIGVDVGISSARAALVTTNGNILKIHSHNIKTWNVLSGFFEQSSEDIWNAVIVCIKNITSQVDPSMVKGVGFDANCSLVCLDQTGQPLSVSPSGHNKQNVILWVDQRASEEANELNRIDHPTLKLMGGAITAEHQLPKLMWLKKYLRTNCWEKAGYFFDLPDFLTWRATGVDSRSVCSLVRKWNFNVKLDGSRVNGTEGWDKSFFERIGLADLAQDNWRKIGANIMVPGCGCKCDLSDKVTKELGLNAETKVGTSILDTYAGALGLIGCTAKGIDPDFDTRVALVSGTSTSHITLSVDPIVIPNVWGPFRHAIFPGLWVNEGGQAATGRLLNKILDTHPAMQFLVKKVSKNNVTSYLNTVLNKISNENDVCYLTTNIHMSPDFQDNKLSINETSLKGMISGLILEKDVKNLALLYLATIQALAYGTKQIITRMKTHGYQLKTLLIYGDLGRNKLYTKTLADACQMSVLVPQQAESVLLGAAMLGAKASGFYPDLVTTVENMGGTGVIVAPLEQVAEFHEKKYKVFLRMIQDQVEYRVMMN